MRTAIRWRILSIAAVAAMGLVAACAAEHPTSEHPTSAQAGSEHPTSEHPEQSAEHPQESAEHPQHSAEHPQESSEHPEEAHSSAEHPAEAHKQKVTKERLADSIVGYVKEDMKLKGGYFMFYDAEKDRILSLKLDHVHRERVAQTAENKFFVCADFRQVSPQARGSSSIRAKEGKVYDLDFWMKRGHDGKLQVTGITLHKEAGEARYQWYEEDGVWKRRM